MSRALHILSEILQFHVVSAPIHTEKLSLGKPRNFLSIVTHKMWEMRFELRPIPFLWFIVNFPHVYLKPPMSNAQSQGLYLTLYLGFPLCAWLRGQAYYVIQEASHLDSSLSLTVPAMPINSPEATSHDVCSPSSIPFLLLLHTSGPMHLTKGIEGLPASYLSSAFFIFVLTSPSLVSHLCLHTHMHSRLDISCTHRPLAQVIWSRRVPVPRKTQTPGVPAIG